jgi:Asp-tRNA(Asn)/Glu-tRNA(Gln) amidotransferase A subunit family amidase
MKGLLSRFLEAREAGGAGVDALLRGCLDRIAARDGDLRAWVEVNRQPATGDGPLAGVPFGVKDIFETRGLATEYGSPLYAGRKGERDAALVATLRRQGGIMVGKTQTTSFAFFDPAPTRNPRAPGRTPGGSSSGSAAAVADGMVPFALGSQTQGSVIRPASYCGIAGFKPTYALLPVDGVLPFAPSLDTVGLFTSTAGDMLALWQRMGFPAMGEVRTHRLGYLDLPAEPEMAAAFREALLRLRAAGFSVEHVAMEGEFEAARAASRAVNWYEGARTHRKRWERYGPGIGVKLAALVEEGLAMPEERYREAVETIVRAKQIFLELFQIYPAVLTPAAPGRAPEGLASTGDPRMNAAFTGLGSPAVTVPLPVGSAPPLGLQIAAAPGNDSALLFIAVAIEDAFC